MKSLSIWAFAAAVLLTGCANEEITERHDIQGENGRKAITVSTYLPSHTRGYNATQADINSLTQELKEGFLMTAVTDDSVIIDAAHYFVNVDTVPNICFTDDGRTYEKLIGTMGEYGYYFNEDLVSGIIVDSEGNVYDAVELDEAASRELVSKTLGG